jgi:hypothetical protein
VASLAESYLDSARKGRHGLALLQVSTLAVDVELEVEMTFY